MTSPTPDARRIDDLTEQQDAELIAAEQAAQQAVAEPLTSDLMRLTTAAIVAWELHQDDPSRVASLLTSLRDGLRGVRVAGMRERLHREALRAFELGVEQGVLQAGEGGVGVESQLPRAIREAIDVVEHRVRSRLLGAAEVATPDLVRSVRDLEDVLARARMAVHTANRTTAFVVTHGVAAGVTAVADELGAERLWVGERDACLHCLAYFGLTALMGEPFPSGLTFARKPLKGAPVPLWNPPMHPHCRCRVVVWRPEWSDGMEISYPDALKREAKRSVARGWSLESESNSARIDAAARLLARVTGSGQLPASVEDYSRRAVSQGAFPRGRRFPG